MNNFKTNTELVEINKIIFGLEDKIGALEMQRITPSKLDVDHLKNMKHYKLQVMVAILREDYFNVRIGKYIGTVGVFYQLTKNEVRSYANFESLNDY